MMMLLLVLCLTFASCLLSIAPRKPADMQNPMRFPKECGREEVQHSAICDPDHFIVKERQDEIEGYINAITSGQIAVAVIRKMDMAQYQSSDKSLAAQSFAVALHDSWGVGGTHGRENGVVIFLSVEDRVVYISTGRDVKHLVTAEEIKVIIESIKPDLRKEDYGRAIALMIIRIELLLQGSGNAHNQGTLLSTSQNSSIPLYGVLAHPLLFFCFLIVAWRFYSSDKKNNREQRLIDGKAKLDAFMQDVNRSLDNKKYITSSCPICLEEYCAEPDKENVEAMDQFQNSPLRPMALVKCSHTFCYGCLVKLFQQKNSHQCPICRVVIDSASDSVQYSGDGQFTYSSFPVAQDIRYRVERMHALYPEVVTDDLSRTMYNTIQGNNISYRDLIQSMSERSAQLHSTLQAMQESRSAAARESGSHGSDSSDFGGGCSDGGGGGGGDW